MDAKSIIEIGVEVTPKQLKGIEGFLRIRRIPYYTEPQPKVPWASLEDLECRCEGK
jgi:hypothetical protein